MDFKDICKAGIVNEGNLIRLRRLFGRAAEGEKLTVGFIGGSITQGCLADTHELCYSYRVFEWFVKTFPKADITYVNAGIGGTTSQFGVARAQEDLLSFAPDFVVIEFSVNDDEVKVADRVAETYEGLVRKCLFCESEPAVIIVNNVRYDTGENVQVIHNKIGDYYKIPCISMKTAIYPLVRDGLLPVRNITEDDLHPNNLGHELIAQAITGFLDEVRASEAVDSGDGEFRPPMTRNSYENSRRLRNMDVMPMLYGFEADERVQEGITDPFKHGWSAVELNSRIVFELPCTGLAIQYRKTINRPTPVAQLIIDGDRENSILLDGNFDQNWGDCVYLETVLEHAELKKRRIEIELIKTHPEDKVPFYLISIIVT